MHIFLKEFDELKTFQVSLFCPCDCSCLVTEILFFSKCRKIDFQEPTCFVTAIYLTKKVVPAFSHTNMHIWYTMGAHLS